MKQKLKYLITISVIIITIFIVIIKIKTKKNIQQFEIEEIEMQNIEPENHEELQKKEKQKTIKVDIKGEVKNPGVYELEEGSRVYDAIKASGDLTEEADTTLLNLSKNLKDEMVIIIYNKNTIEKLKKDLTTTKTVIEYIEKECTCPDTINDACITKENKNTTQDKTEKTEIQEINKETKISINTASLEELTKLPGIGESKAKAIIEYREQNGEFKTTEEIKNISGIGESTFEKFKEYITI